MLAGIGVLAFSIQVLGMTALHPGAVPWVVAGLQAYGMWIAPIAAASAACFLAVRSGAPLVWPIVGCALIALLGAATNASFEWSPAVPRGMLSGGIGLHFPDVGLTSSLRAILTILTVLGPVLWLRRRRRELSSRARLALNLNEQHPSTVDASDQGQQNPWNNPIDPTRLL